MFFRCSLSLESCTRTHLLAALIVCGCFAYCTATVRPVDVNLTKAGENAVLKCEVTRLDENVTAWYRNSMNASHVKIDQGDGSKYIIENNTLTVLKVGENDVGTYMCQVNGTEYQVSINVVPIVKPLDKSKNLVEGETLTLDCYAWGNPKPTILWVRTEIDEGFKTVINNDTDSRSVVSDSTTMPEGVLTYSDLTPSDYMYYSCVAINHLGASNTTTLVRVKDNLAPLWPFIGICIEVILLVIVIVVYEKRRTNYQEEDIRREEAETLTNSTGHKGQDDVRSRK